MMPILGIVENMAYFTPAELPENKYYIFGKAGGMQNGRTNLNYHSSVKSLSYKLSGKAEIKVFLLYWIANQ